MKICSNEIIELQELVVDYNNFLGDEPGQKIVIDLGRKVGVIEVYQGEYCIGFGDLDKKEEIETIIKKVNNILLDDDRYEQHLLEEEYATKVTDFEIAIKRGKC